MSKHFKENGGDVHCSAPGDAYRTLCRISLDDRSDRQFMVETMEGIDCENCISIIKFCWKIRAPQIKLPFQRRRA